MIYLAYGRWDNGYLLIEGYDFFEPFEFEHKQEKMQRSGRTLTQEPYRHVLARRDVWTVVLGADDYLNELRRRFIERFFYSNCNYFGYEYGEGYWDYCYVDVRGDKTLPITTEDNIERIKLELEKINIGA